MAEGGARQLHPEVGRTRRRRAHQPQRGRHHLTGVRIDRDRAAPGPLVAGFAGTGFRVGDSVHPAGLLLTPETAADWDPPAIDALQADDVAAALAIDPLPEFLLLGTGDRLVRPPAGFVAALDARGIGVEPMDSRAAARAWGLLRGEGRWIAAALMPLR